MIPKGGNQNPQIEGQTTQWPKGQGLHYYQCIKHTYDCYMKYILSKCS
jgi:hypothetical protein